MTSQTVLLIFAFSGEIDLVYQAQLFASFVLSSLEFVSMVEKQEFSLIVYEIMHQEQENR